MTPIFSVILAFMLSIGSGVNQNVNLSQKSHLGLKVENHNLHQVQTLENAEQQPVLRVFIRNSRLMVEFISTDPIINKKEALANPQLWNLYAYCGNNPITFIDPDGKKIVIDSGQYHDEIQQAVNIGRATRSGATLFEQLNNDPRTITLKGGSLPVTTQNGITTATCGQKTGHTIKNNFIESVDFTIDFNNVTNYHSDTTGVNPVWHELFHASAYMQSNQQTGISWIQVVGIAWRQDQPVQGGQGTGTQRGTAGQFGAQVAQEAVNMISNLLDSI